jgi:Ca2+-binding RTX toxin-like protein
VGTWVSVDKVVIQSQYSLDLQASGDEQFVSNAHFGGNIVATKNGVSEGGPFQQGVDTLGISSLRYPGGTLTEKYFDPHGTVWDQLFGSDRSDYATSTDGTSVLGPKPFFQYANENGHSVTFVLPTASLLMQDANGNTIIDQAALAEVKSVVGEIIRGNFGPVKIDSFEIGNEYFHYADMSAQEYGLIANELIHAVGDEFTIYENEAQSGSHWHRPEITIQAGAGWQPGDNEEIISCLDDDSRDLIDRVAIHYYPQNIEQVEHRDDIFNQIHAWEGAEGFHSLNFFASEWNIQNSSESDTGLSQASSLISAFDEMLAKGIDSASIWGVQNRWLDTSLTTLDANTNVAENDPEARTRLTASGEIFASMAESLPGLQSFQLDPVDLIGHIRPNNSNPIAEPSELVINSFGDTDRAVIYISSRSDEVIQFDLDLNTYFNDPTHVWGEILTTVDDPTTLAVDESDPLNPRGLPVFQSLSGDQLADGHTVTLPPHAIIRIDVQLNGGGVTMLGHNPLTDETQSYEDTFSGSSGADSINGYAGNDTLSGLNGHDAVNGGKGDDYLYGGNGEDVERGGVGNDQIEGGNGNDVLSGGEGEDRILGSSGNDIISSGSGDDQIFGGAGNDVIFTDDGNDLLFGGAGSDYFIASSDGKTTIKDWQFDGGDKITFLGQFVDPEDLADHASETEGTAEAPGDLILRNEAGGEVVFVGAAGRLHELTNQVVDFSEVGQSALDLADNLNQMTGHEIGEFLDSLSTEEFDSQILRPDPVILLASLHSDKAGEFLGRMDPEESDNFLNHIGREGFAAFFEELNMPETEDFVANISSPALVNVIDQYGGNEFLSHLDDCSEATRATFTEKLDETKYDYLGQGHDQPDPADGDADGGEIPTVPVDEDVDEQTDDTAAADDPSMACFVATVAYANSNHPDVWTLRWYRDNVLRTSSLGLWAIRIYWIFGPKLANAVRNKPKIVEAFRRGLMLFVRLICWYYGRSSGRQFDHIVVHAGRLSGRNRASPASSSYVEKES